MPWSAEQRLSELGIDLPPAGSPQAAYASCVQVGALLFVSGKGPGAPVTAGRLGRELTTADGARLARSAGLEVLATVRDFLGSLDEVARVVRVQGFVNATEDYAEHHLALDGLSTLFVDVFGDAGIHTRSVLGAVSLRGGLPIIVECLFEVRDQPCP
ncbi:RidA family protein [Cellulomonas xiejunii]|uniref:RidA family protein n=1 Tax=Cellulomonas xiejunii TaxID=2968083 RepID=A0ABY5KKR6_9CELL|nr:RidA family protein [Cellulomonas xiejunii]MCC2315865.1 RidA family protein [Cellulomonas xiejunii]MCC2320784.1 RidA family protein [Cellulomonas xiejunii]UUI71071.1 RidA family protein [Cellulomonas xiejunii]